MRGKSVRRETVVRNRERGQNWVIAFDEFHPDPQIAALFADINAKRTVQGWLNEQLRRFAAQPKLSHDDKAKRAEVKQQLADAIAEQARLEHLASEWYPAAA